MMVMMSGGDSRPDVGRYIGALSIYQGRRLRLRSRQLEFLPSGRRLQTRAKALEPKPRRAGALDRSLRPSHRAKEIPRESTGKEKAPRRRTRIAEEGGVGKAQNMASRQMDWRG